MAWPLCFSFNSFFLFVEMRWQDAGARKKFFLDFAKREGFDPLVPENWYNAKRISLQKYAKTVPKYHNNSLMQALLDLFPNIGLCKRKLFKITHWDKPEERRLFFLDYAQDKKFDPLQPENWYKHNKKSFLAWNKAWKQGSSHPSTLVLSYHKGSLSQALLDLFPDIALDKSKMRP